MDCTRLRDGKPESRNTREGVVSQEMQSLLLKLLPENPAAPALRRGARGVLSLNDFVTQREFERTALYNEIMRPINVRFQLLVPLECGLCRRCERKSSFAFLSRGDQEAALVFPSSCSCLFECPGIHKASGSCFRCPATRPAPRAWSHSPGVSYHALAHSGQA